MDEKKRAAANRARLKYAQAHETQFKFALNNVTDADIIEHVRKQENKAGYFKRLVREDIARGG